MRRLVVAFAAAASLAAAGCGGDDDVPTPRPPDVVEAVEDEAQQAIDKLDETDLPEDAKRELEAAKELLEEAQP